MQLLVVYWDFTNDLYSECVCKRVNCIPNQFNFSGSTHLPWQYINIAIFGSRAWIHDLLWVEIWFPRCHTCTALSVAKKSLGAWVKVDTLGFLRRDIMSYIVCDNKTISHDHLWKRHALFQVTDQQQEKLVRVTV